MAEFPLIPVWTDALITDTFHLTPAEFGAYVRLLIVAWRRPDCNLPNDDAYLGRCTGDPKHWYRLKPLLMNKPFFELRGDGFYMQKRLLRERERVMRRSRGAKSTPQYGHDSGPQYGHDSSPSNSAKSLKSKKVASAKYVLNGAQKSAPLTLTISNKKEAIKNGFLTRPDTPEFQAWLKYVEDSGQNAFARELKDRVLQGRAFNFETQWPPGHS